MRLREHDYLEEPNLFLNCGKAWMSINSPIQVTLSHRFATETHQLTKRYRRTRLDIQPVIDQLEAGELQERSQRADFPQPRQQNCRDGRDEPARKLVRYLTHRAFLRL